MNKRGNTFFRYAPRGIGSNWIRCFVCGFCPGELREDGLHYSGSCQNDMAAFVDGKEGGERVVALLRAYGFTAFLDYRDFEPDWVQVKLGVCEKHLPFLEMLFRETYRSRELTPTLLEVLRKRIDEAEAERAARQALSAWEEAK